MHAVEMSAGPNSLQNQSYHTHKHTKEKRKEFTKIIIKREKQLIHSIESMFSYMSESTGKKTTTKFTV
jgi:hypothetical protein